MTTAPTYNRVYNFTNYQASNPATPLPASQVDAELSAIKITLDATLQNLSLIQKSDGTLANNIVGTAQLSTVGSFGFNFRGPWATGVTYAQGDGAFYNYIFYVANLPHVAGVTTPNNDATNWRVGADFTGSNLALAQAQAAAAAASAVTASGWSTTASGYATNAANSATAASGYATNAANSATAASNFSIAAGRGHLAGLTLSTAGSSATFGIAAGVAMSDDATTLMALASAYTKTTGAWAVGTGNGALDTGSIANSTWYHVFLIENVSGPVVDVLISTSLTPTLPGSYTKKRRIGSMKTDGSAKWVLFTQLGDEFLWSVSVADVNTSTLGTTATLYTISVPPGVQVKARLRGQASNGSTYGEVSIQSPDESAQAVSPSTINFLGATGVFTAGAMDVRTSTSAQIRAVAYAAATSLNLGTYGWIDDRGRFA